jgi:hypothetical protein
MTANILLQKLVTIYRGEEIRYPQLRAVTLAQWMLESGRARSDLAKLHYNFGGIKWRREMAPHATKIEYEASDGVDDYCKFATIENFSPGIGRFSIGRLTAVGKNTSKQPRTSSGLSGQPTRQQDGMPRRCSIWCRRLKIS